MQGLFHIYTGDGKGKTTCAVGLAVRAIGAGKRVLVGQFLKGIPSAEVEVLRTLGVQLLRMEDAKKFSWQMNQQEAAEMRRSVHNFFEMILTHVNSGKWDLVIMDEALGAWKSEGVKLEELCNLVDQRPEGVELVFTGRGAPEELIRRADYVSVVVGVKHPYEKGIGARKGIDF